jgi:hypothetical protein
MKYMHRCPCSMTTREISDGLRHYSWREGGSMPECGGILEQSPSYLQFCSVVSSEVARVQREKMENK